jgi:HSP20 family protein
LNSLQRDQLHQEGGFDMANIIRRENNNNEVARTTGSDYRWDPFRMMDAFLRWDPFRGDTGSLFSHGGEFTPRFDIKETKAAYVIKADLPGLNEEDVNVSVTGHQLTVSGRREQEQRNEDDQFYTVERSAGSFARTFSLPDAVDPDAVKADMRNGVLTLEIPKRPEAQPKKIAIGRTGGGNGDKPKS